MISISAHTVQHGLSIMLNHDHTAILRSCSLPRRRSHRAVHPPSTEIHAPVKLLEWGPHRWRTRAARSSGSTKPDGAGRITSDHSSGRERACSQQGRAGTHCCHGLQLRVAGALVSDTLSTGCAQAGASHCTRVAALPTGLSLSQCWIPGWIWAWIDRVILLPEHQSHRLPKTPPPLAPVVIISRLVGWSASSTVLMTSSSGMLRALAVALSWLRTRSVRT